MSRLLAAQRALTVPGWAKDELSRKAQAIPSLDLRFADSKSLVDATTGANLVTFTRASSGTYVGSDGVLRTATTNLLLRSEEFGTTWSTGDASITSDTTTAPNGTTTADKLVENNLNAQHNVRQAFAASNVTLTFSVYVKAAERSRVFLQISNNSTGAAGLIFNLSSGTAGTPTNSGDFTSTSGTIVAVGNGWFRCSITSNKGSTNTTAWPFVSTVNNSDATSYLGDGTSGLFLWGAQLEQSATVGEYIPTTSTINSAPRFDHNPTTGESLGLLVEEQRTNLLVRSEEFDNASWVKTLATVTSNAGIAPNGSTVADKLVGNSTVDAHYVQQNIAGATSGTPYTSSVYAKAAEISRIEILHVIGATLYAQGYDLSNGTLITRVAGGTTAATGGFMQPVGNGWYRCGITQTSDGTSGAMRVTLRSGSTVGFDATSQGVLLWGAQLEAGAFPTSYIPTTTAAATRSADVASITGTAFSSWYRQDEGTVFSSNRLLNTSGNQVVTCISDGTVNDEIVVYQSTQFFNLVNDNGVAQANSSGGVPLTGTDLRNAFGIQAANFQAYAQGNALAAQLAGTMPTPNRMTIGSRVNSSLYLNGTIRRLAYWGQRLPNNALQTLTQ